MTSTIQQALNEYNQIIAEVEQISKNKAFCKKLHRPFTGPESVTEEQKARYSELSKIIVESSKDLKREEVTIYCHGFDGTLPNFAFCYAEKEGQTKLIPLSKREISTLRYQMEKEGVCKWPIRNPVTNELFVPVIKKDEDVEIEDYLETDESVYFQNSIEEAKKDNTSRRYRILEALSPYAYQIQQVAGKFFYKELVALFPDLYSENI